MFSIATTVICILTLACIGINVLGWIRIRGLYQLALSGGNVPVMNANRKIKGVGQLGWLIRLESGYFTLLFIYLLTYPNVVATLPALFVIFYHWLGFSANKVTSATRKLCRGLKANELLTPEGRSKTKKAVLIIGILDIIEIAILVYIAITTLRLGGGSVA